MAGALNPAELNPTELALALAEKLFPGITQHELADLAGNVGALAMSDDDADLVAAARALRARLSPKHEPIEPGRVTTLPDSDPPEEYRIVDKLQRRRNDW